MGTNVINSSLSSPSSLNITDNKKNITICGNLDIKSDFGKNDRFNDLFAVLERTCTKNYKVPGIVINKNKGDYQRTTAHDSKYLSALILSIFFRNIIGHH